MVITRMDEVPKIQFALGSEASPGHFFESNFARSFVNGYRDTKSLNFGYDDHGTIIEEVESIFNDTKNNNFYSLNGFQNGNDNAKIWLPEDEIKLQRTSESSELKDLRKQCQALTEENKRLHNCLTSNEVPHVRLVDNVCLQNQVDMLQWRVNQMEINRQMYRSLLDQVLRFLDRTRKSLDILHEKNNPKGKNSRVPRSRSVHAVHAEASGTRGTSSSLIDDSSFTRAKSVTQIAPSNSGARDFTWSVLRRNDPAHCTPPRGKPPQDSNKSHEGIAYRRPKQLELNPDDVPPEKLSQEAFRLMRTVQSLLAVKEPDLARVPHSEDNVSPSPVEQDMTSQANFANNRSSQESPFNVSERGSSGTDSVSEKAFSRKDSGTTPLPGMLPGARRSLDATSLNSGSSKTTETTEEDDTDTLTLNQADFTRIPTSTPIRCKKRGWTSWSIHANQGLSYGSRTTGSSLG
ncbi:uncharacterized protein LOC107269265 isoform X2 [Cephus cinctus]|uniref:Uncharacterized protein LOC107269265 isoform X2 n=1 Tax=Cephus cinctus TaxID=211228 RepID=A0AAJ7FM02_CEPCN|nr:uncharacterized protein LOC107269265 isoform X2 [Cephus cinctus]